MTTYEDAIDEIFALVKNSWNENTLAITGYTPKLYFQGVQEKNNANLSKFWARLSQQTVTEEQETLRNSSGVRRYKTSGLVFVQIFCPKSDTQSMEKGRKLAIVGRDAVRGKTTSSGCVWFRNARINELPPEEKWYRFNVVAEYEYDEIG